MPDHSIDYDYSYEGSADMAADSADYEMAMGAPEMGAPATGAFERQDYQGEAYTYEDFVRDKEDMLEPESSVSLVNSAFYTFILLGAF